MKFNPLSFPMGTISGIEFDLNDDPEFIGPRTERCCVYKAHWDYAVWKYEIQQELFCEGNGQIDPENLMVRSPFSVEAYLEELSEFYDHSPKVTEELLPQEKGNHK